MASEHAFNGYRECHIESVLANMLLIFMACLHAQLPDPRHDH